MATTKSYTDLSQSKVLAEILPLESADMYWKNGISDKYIQCFTPFVIDDYRSNVDYDYDVFCWSLAALLDILSKSAYFINEAGIAELSSIKATKWCICILNCGKIGNCYADNPIDACVAMIEKLNELKML